MWRRVWDASTGECRHTLAGHTSWVHCVAISPDNATIVSGGNDNLVRCVWLSSPYATSWGRVGKIEGWWVDEGPGPGH